MFGKNPIRKPLKGDGSILEVQEIFATIQGEGPNAGMPAVFIRLGGCNLACRFCDTEFESFKEVELGQILDKVSNFAGNSIGLVVITGGEPLRQPIEFLCRELVGMGFRVQIETNGTLYRELPHEVEIVCSPKNTGKGYAPVRDDLLRRLSALKFIISANDNLYGEVADVGQGKYNTPVYVQPMDEIDEGRNKMNLELATRLARQNGFRLSIQQHKTLGLP